LPSVPVGDDMDGTLKVQTPKDARFGPLFNENTTPTLSRGQRWAVWILPLVPFSPIWCR